VSDGLTLVGCTKKLLTANIRHIKEFPSCVTRYHADGRRNSDFSKNSIASGLYIHAI